MCAQLVHAKTTAAKIPKQPALPAPGALGIPFVPERNVLAGCAQI
jgi:hypothetical protein